MGKKTPKAPDYNALAVQQGAQDRQTAQFNTGLNRVTQQGPTSTTSWSLRPGADPNNIQPGDYIQNTALSGDQQALLDQREQLGLQAGGMVQLGAPSTAGLAALRGGVAPTTQATPGGYEGARSSVEQALLARMEPGLAQNEERVYNRLAQAGHDVGSEGYAREANRLDRARTDAQIEAILAGGQEQSRLAGLDMAQQGQAFQQGLSTNEADRMARMQGLTERMQLNQMPLDQLSQIYDLGLAGGGAPANYPDFFGGGQAQTPDTLGAAQAGYGSQMQSAAQRQANTNATISSIAMAAALFF